MMNKGLRQGKIDVCNQTKDMIKNKKGPTVENCKPLNLLG